LGAVAIIAVSYTGDLNVATLGGAALSSSAGINFSMSLFIGILAFAKGPVLQGEVKIGILGGSLLAGLLGGRYSGSRPRRQRHRFRWKVEAFPEMRCQLFAHVSDAATQGFEVCRAEQREADAQYLKLVTNGFHAETVAGRNDRER
jgi:Na+/H+ antiporter 1